MWKGKNEYEAEIMSRNMAIKKNQEMAIQEEGDKLSRKRKIRRLKWAGGIMGKVKSTMFYSTD